MIGVTPARIEQSMRARAAADRAGGKVRHPQLVAEALRQHRGAHTAPPRAVHLAEHVTDLRRARLQLWRRPTGHGELGRAALLSHGSWTSGSSPSRRGGAAVAAAVAPPILIPATIPVAVPVPVTVSVAVPIAGSVAAAATASATPVPVPVVITVA